MKHSVLALFLVVISATTCAQTADVTLEQAIKLAMENHPTVAAAKLETSRRVAVEPTAFELPRTEVSVLFGQYNSIQKGDNNISVSQILPFPALFARQHASNKASTNAARLQESVVINEIIFQVKQIFNELLYLKARGHLLIRHDSLINELVRISRVQLQAGEGTLLSVRSTEAQLMEVANLRVRNEADVRRAIDQLRLLCQSHIIDDVTGSLENSPVLIALDSLSFQNNPSLALNEQYAELMEHNRRVEKARVMPDLRVGYFNQTLIGTQNVDGRDQYFDSGKRFQGFQLGLSFPLWFGPHAARIKAASIAIDVVKKENEVFSLNLVRQFRQASKELVKNRESVEYYRTSALKAADLLVLQSRRSFQYGEIELSTLLLNIRHALTIYEGYLLALQQFNSSVNTIDYLSGTM